MLFRTTLMKPAVNFWHLPRGERAEGEGIKRESRGRGSSERADHEARAHVSLLCVSLSLSRSAFPPFPLFTFPSLRPPARPSVPVPPYSIFSGTCAERHTRQFGQRRRRTIFLRHVMLPPSLPRSLPTLLSQARGGRERPENLENGSGEPNCKHLPVEVFAPAHTHTHTHTHTRTRTRARAH